MTTERIDIIIREDGSRTIIRNLNDVGGAAGGAARGIGLLRTALGTLGAAVSVAKLRELADEYVNIQNRLRLVTTGQSNLNAVFDELQRISAATGSSLQANAQLYSRVALSARELGTSQAELLTFTERLNKAIKISGATATEAAGGLIQLSQGLASGRLGGEELRTVLEQLPAVADVIAKGLGVTRGELRQLGAEGKITAREVLDAFKKAGPELEEAFSKIVLTSAENFVILRNQVVETVGKFDAAVGVSTNLSSALANVTEIVKALTPQIINVGRAIGDTLDPTDELSTGMAVLSTILVAIIGVLKLVGIVVKTVVFTAFQALGNLIGGLAVSLGKFGEGLVETFSAVAETVKSVARGDLENLGNPFAEAGKRFAESDAAFSEAFKGSAEIISKNFTEGDAALIDSASFTVEKLVKIWDEGARRVQENRVKAGAVGTDAGSARTPGPSQKDLKALESLQNKLRGVLNEIAPLEGAILEYEKAQRILNQATEKGLITKADEADFLELLRLKYVDILDPLRKLNRELDEETRLLALGSREREVEAQLLDATKKLREDGVNLSGGEVQALRDKFTAMQKLNEITQLQDQLLAGSVGQRQGFIDQVQAIKTLLDDPTSGFTSTDASAAVGQALPGLFDGTQEQIDLELDRFRDLYQQIDILRQADLISEQTAQIARSRVAIEQDQFRLQNQRTFFNQLAQLSGSENRKIAAIGKAAAVATATIDGVAAVQKALASAPPPANYALAAATGVAAAANVAQIAGVGFATGGSFAVGGSGGVDSQMVSFRATPGERVAVSTPQQVRKGTSAQESGGGSDEAQGGRTPLTIVNLLDPQLFSQYLDTPEGEQKVVNIIGKNKEALQG